MGGVCSTYGGEQRCLQGFGGETWGKRLLGRPRSRCRIILRRFFGKWGVGGMDWIELAQERDRWRALRVPWNAGNFLTSCKPVSCSGSTLHHGVSKQVSHSTLNDCCTSLGLQTDVRPVLNFVLSWLMGASFSWRCWSCLYYTVNVCVHFVLYYFACLIDILKYYIISFKWKVYTRSMFICHYKQEQKIENCFCTNIYLLYIKNYIINH